MKLQIISNIIRYTGLLSVSIVSLFAISGCGKAAVALNQKAEASQIIGKDEIKISTEQQLEIQTIAVKSIPLADKIRRTGKTSYSEGHQVVFTSRVAGRVESLANLLGSPVRKGEAVAMIFSTDYITALGEYRMALNLEKRYTAIADKRPELLADARESVQATRQKLLLLGVTPSDIDETLKVSDGTLPLLPLHAIRDGVITLNNLKVGMQINPGDLLFMISDLHHLWMYTDIYEQDLARVSLGQRVEVQTMSLPNEVFRGRISYISPSVDPDTRLIKVRIEVINPGEQLRAEMFTTASIFLTQPRPVIALPSNSFLKDQDKTVTFISSGPGRYKKVEVQKGREYQDEKLVAVTQGIKAGDQVVVKGGLLLKNILDNALAGSGG